MYTQRGLTPAFSCDARSAFKPRSKMLLEKQAPRRQLQGFVGRNRGKKAPRRCNEISNPIDAAINMSK